MHVPPFLRVNPDPTSQVHITFPLPDPRPGRLIRRRPSLSRPHPTNPLHTHILTLTVFALGRLGIPMMRHIPRFLLVDIPGPDTRIPFLGELQVFPARDEADEVPERRVADELCHLQM